MPRTQAAHMTQPPQLFLTRDALRLGSDRDLRRAVTQGNVVRLRSGVYISNELWQPMTPDERYQTRVRAAAHVSAPQAQFSHDSAAALWNLPSIGRWPDVIHELAPKDTGGRSRVGISRHCLGLDPTAVELDGLTVTSIARTVIDMACTTPFVRAVAMADAALRRRDRTTPPRTTSSELFELLSELVPYRGMSRAQRVAEFATGLSGSAGESFARVQFHALGFPPPELQVDFYDSLGFIGCVDFYWRELGLIVESDGKSKYGARRSYQLDLTTEQIVLKEKDREDRLRRVANDFVRLDWDETKDRRVLAAVLAPYGLIEARGRG